MPLYVRTVLVTGAPDAVEPSCRAHEQHLAGLRRQGKLRTAGALKDGDGYLDIFEAEDRLEAESIARSSPLVEAGWASWTLREWSEL
jgi:uncharacterized protein YciI